LVGSTDPAWVVENLFLDSLLFLKTLPTDSRDLLDLGAGAGFPGVPLKIVEPALRLTLVEAKSRRASFLSTLVRELELVGVRVINDRAEHIVDQTELRFDAVVMRCAGSLDAVLPLAGRLLKPGGVAIASGPPKVAKLPVGDWVEVAGPNGIRRFAIHTYPRDKV
jgi:16S rRNA (guanine527-N7)-methyltransferase